MAPVLCPLDDKMMIPPIRWRRVWLLLCVPGHLGRASSPGHEVTAASANPTSASSTPGVCESRTINYITHTLPQQCLRTSWTAPASASDAQATELGTATMAVNPEPTRQQDDARSDDPSEGRDADVAKDGQSAQDEGNTGEESEDLATSSFMSFEEWKEMMVRKAGQEPDQARGQKQREQRERGEQGPTQMDMDSIGDDGEISLDFEVLADKVSEMAASSSGGGVGARSDTKEVKDDHVVLVEGTHRSKDAGKTCKERFSFTSFDAGATILKTSPGAKNPKNILVENKDSYMLLECHTKNKFVIVELSDDILVDTVVLANYEFFSSMIRRFRVSVSARYPVKLDKWVELGTFEARNSRDIQPFLVQHPQIYTKYIRIEFLSHYGTEYYCPVSLLRVHGMRMLDTWKDQDNSPEDEAEETIDPPTEVPEVESNVAEPVPMTDAALNITAQQPVEVPLTGEMGLTPWEPVLAAMRSHEVCLASSPTTPGPTPGSDNDLPSNTTIPPESAVGPSQTPNSPSSAEAGETASPVSSPTSSAAPAKPTGSDTTGAAAASTPPPISSTDMTVSSQKHPQTRANGSDPQPSSSFSKIPNTASTSIRTNKTSTASAPAAPSPTVQESFFKAVTKRLQHLESNTSLSLQYIEEQSRFLQEALQKMEKKQISRVDAFLDSLNKTVLSELRNVRTQYDQIWQSTVLALETQRDQSQREIVALSTRLNVLADEVVFQKRMAILQSVLLLSCLVLVIFSRGFVPSSLDNLGLNSQVGFAVPAVGSRALSARTNRADDSPPPPLRPGGNISGSNSNSNSLGRVPSGRHLVSRPPSFVDKSLPLTPSPEFSRESTPIIQVDDVEAPSSFFEETPPDFAAMTPPPSGPENETSTEPDSLESTPEATLALPRHSTMPQLGGVGARKPLPALPEDPISI